MEKKDNKNQLALEKFIKENTKELVLGDLSPECRLQLKKATKELELFEKEVEEKREQFSNQSKMRNEQLSKLEKMGALKIDQSNFQRSEIAFKEYEKLLDDILLEIKKELDFCSELSSEGSSKTVRVAKESTLNAKDYVNEKIKQLKKYIKKVQKDLRISFSKYNYGLESQLKELSYVEAYFKAKK